MKRENASFPAPPSPQILLPCPALGVHGPSAPGPERSCTPSEGGQDPSPQGGLCWQEFVPEGSREAEGPPPVLSSSRRKVTLPLGDVCIPFLNPPNKAFPLGGSCYSPDSAPSLFRMGTEPWSPPPRAPAPTATPLVCCRLSGLGQPHGLKITWATPNPCVGTSPAAKGWHQLQGPSLALWIRLHWGFWGGERLAAGYQ